MSLFFYKKFYNVFWTISNTSLLPFKILSVKWEVASSQYRRIFVESLACFIIIFHFESIWLNIEVSRGKFLIANGDFNIGYK